ncbi:MAG: hypothetical protein RL769_452, partial [Pseudomonadota bacterium]
MQTPLINPNNPNNPNKFFAFLDRKGQEEFRLEYFKNIDKYSNSLKSQDFEDDVIEYDKDKVGEFDFTKPKIISLSKLSGNIEKFISSPKDSVKIFKVKNYSANPPHSAEVIYYKKDGQVYSQVIPAGNNFADGLIGKAKDELIFYLYLSSKIINVLSTNSNLSEDIDSRTMTSLLSNLVLLNCKLKSPDRNQKDYLLQDFTDLKKNVRKVYSCLKDKQEIKKIIQTESTKNSSQDLDDDLIEQQASLIVAQRFAGSVANQEQI